MRTTRPQVFVFDVIETLFSLEPLQAGFAAAGFPEGSMRTWFASLLRDAFALENTGDYQPFKTIAMANLRALALSTQLSLSDERLETILTAVAGLPAYPDVLPSFALLRKEGIPIVALTNGSAETTRAMFEKSHLAEYVEVFLSIDEIGHWKPSPKVYLHAATAMQRSPSQLALVAAHAWDVHGAKRAGLQTGFVSRHGESGALTELEPDVHGSSVEEVVRSMLAFPAH